MQLPSLVNSIQRAAPLGRCLWLVGSYPQKEAVGATMTKPAARAILVEMPEPIILTIESPADGRALVALPRRHGLSARAAGAEVEMSSAGSR